MTFRTDRITFAPPGELPELPFRRTRATRRLTRRGWLLAGSALVAAIAVAFMLRRRRSRTRYQRDAIDFAGAGHQFGERDAPPRGLPANHIETRTDISAQQLSMAARLEASLDDLKTLWPWLTTGDLRAADGDIDELVRAIAERTDERRRAVRERLDGVLERSTPRPSYPAH